MKNKTALYLTRGALCAALYVVLTHLSNAFGLASGAIQLRISEALCIMPLFYPEAIVGIFIGCIISNLTTGGLIWDVIFGSLATLIGLIGAWLLRKLTKKLIFIATIPTVLANALIIPPVLMYAYGVEDGFWFLFATVGLGELISATVFGTILFFSMKKAKL